MAQVQFYKITYAQLQNLAIKDGQMIFTTDTGKLYLDKSNSERIQIDGIDFTYGLSLDGTSISIVKNGGSSSITLPVVTTTSAGLMSAADKTKLDGIAEGATRVIVDDTISASSTNPVQNSVIKAALDNKISTSLKGAVNGVAELDAIGKVPSSQLPSYVDDVVEGYLYNSKFYKESTHTTEIAGETGKIYVDLTTEKTYRWSGTAFVEISASLALGETSSTAYRGDRGVAAYTHAVTNKGSAFTNGFYKITTNEEGHVTAATAVQKSDITNLGIPGENITYTIDNEDSEILLKGSDDSSQTILSAGTNITIDNNNEISAQTDEEVEEFINGDSILVSEENTKLAIENTADSAPMKINLGGNTKQDSLTGINLLNTYNINTTLSDLVLTSDENGIITINGTSTAGNVWLKQDLSFPLNGTYTLIFKKISGEMTTTGTVRIGYTIGNSSNTGAAAIPGRLITDTFDKNSSVIVTTATINDTLASLSMYINPDATFTNYKVAIYLVQGTYTSENIPDYQPYVGGYASPNPDYPQNIEVVTGNNTIVIQNKNIFNNSNLKESKYIDYSSSAVGNTIVFGTSAASNCYYKCAYLEANKTYKISYEYDSTKSTGHRFGAITDENDVVLQICRTWNETPKNVTIQPTQSGYLSICVDKNSYNIQIEENTQVTSYVEHQEQNYEINLGKNLLNVSNLYSVTTTQDVNIKLHPGNYTISCSEIATDISGENSLFIFYHQDNTSEQIYFSHTNKVGTIAISKETTYVRIYSGSSWNNSNGKTTTFTELMIEEGSTATTYKPYFTPIELCKIGDYKDKIRKSTGKNLFDKDNAIILNAIPYDNKISSTSNGKTTYINCLPNTTYTISKIAGNRFQVCTTNTIPELETSIDNHITNNNASSITITTGNNANYLCVYFYHHTDTITQQEMLDSIQIEQGLQPTDIEPYGVGIWYKYKEIGKVVLDGTDINLREYNNHNSTTYFTVNYTGTYIKRLSSGFISNISDKLKGTTITNTWRGNILNSCSQATNGNYIQICMPYSIASDLTSLNNWLTNNNITIYYPLANPTYEIIENQELINQLDNLEQNAKSYLSQTNITQENAEQPFTLKIEGYKDNAHGMYQSALDQIQYYSAGKNISIDKNNVISASTDDSVNLFLYGSGSRTINDDSAFTIYDGFPTSPIEFKLKGNSYQQTYSGKNLYNTNINRTVANITIVGNGEYVEINGTPANEDKADIGVATLPAGTYTITSEFLDGNTNVTGWIYYTGSWDKPTSTSLSVAPTSKKASVTFTLSEQKDVCFGLYYVKYIDYQNCKIRLQIVEGSTPDYDYEKFVGGTPSPNPDYPQDIEVVTGNNTITITNSDNTQSQNYEINLGKNLFDKDNQVKVQVNSSGTLRYGIIVDAPNKKVSISAKTWNNSIALKPLINGVYGDFLNINSNMTVNVADKLIIYATSDNNKLDYNIEELQIEIGNITSYSPYFSPIELCKIGDYKDEIRKSTGKNLFDVSQGFRNGYLNTSTGVFTSENQSFVSNQYINVIGGKSYCYSLNQNITNLAIYSFDENKDYIKREAVAFAKDKLSVTLDNNAKYVVLGGNYNNSTTVTQEILNSLYIQFETGLERTDIEPYGKDVWYKYCEVGKIDLSTLTWSSTSADTTGYRRYYTNTIPNIKYVSSNTEVGSGLAEKYSIVKGQGISALINVFAIDVSFISFMDLQSNNKPTGLLYYALANPTYEIITETQLIKQLNNLSKAEIDQYYTTVSQYNDSIPFILDMTYYLNNVDGRYFGNLSKIKNTETIVDDYLSSNSINPVQNNIITDKFNTKIDSGDVSFTQTLTSGAAVGTLTIEGQSTTLYAPNPGAVATELATTNTLYLTGVSSTAATQGDQIYNTRTATTSGISYSPTTQVAYINGSALESQANKTLSVSYPGGLDNNADNVYPSAGAVWRAEHLLRHIFGLDINTFSASSTYAVGDYVLYLDKLYKCTTAVTTAGTWNSSNWTETQIFTL